MEFIKSGCGTGVYVSSKNSSDNKVNIHAGTRLIAHMEASADVFSVDNNPYAFCENGKIVLTLAGVNKERGSAYFAEHGIEAFKKHCFLDAKTSGRNTAYYNTEPIHKLYDNGQPFTSASNVAIIPSTYELGVTDEYEGLIKIIKGELY